MEVALTGLPLSFDISMVRWVSPAESDSSQSATSHFVACWNWGPEKGDSHQSGISAPKGRNPGGTVFGINTAMVTGTDEAVWRQSKPVYLAPLYPHWIKCQVTQLAVQFFIHRRSCIWESFPMATEYGVAAVLRQAYLVDEYIALLTQGAR